MVKFYRKSKSKKELLEFHRDCELPVPGYRALLQLYLSHLYRDPLDYVNGLGPVSFEIFPMAPNDNSSSTFEVRAIGRVPLKGNIEAVFLPEKLAFCERYAMFRAQYVGPRIVVCGYPERNREGYRLHDALIRASLKYLQAKFTA